MGIDATTAERGANLVIWHRNANQIREDLLRLRARGYTAVALHHTMYCTHRANYYPVPCAPSPQWADTTDWIWPDIAQDPEHPKHNTPDPAVVRWALWYGRKIGLRMINKCASNVIHDGSWQGNLSIYDAYQTPARWDVRDKFFSEYWLRVVKPNAQICASTKTMLCFGVEMYGWTKETAMASMAGQPWQYDMVLRIRSVAPTIPLTYACNHSHEWQILKQSGFWDWFLYENPGNMRGLDLYTPLSALPTRDMTTLTDGARVAYAAHFWDDRPDQIARTRLTECGYPAIPEAASEPWGVPEERLPPVPDTPAQTACYLAWHSAFSGVGAFAWQVRAETQKEQHDLANNPDAEAVFLGEVP